MVQDLSSGVPSSFTVLCYDGVDLFDNRASWVGASHFTGGGGSVVSMAWRGGPPLMSADC